ncbi:uncharacterized protein N7511_002889 [Penicillium nucicola]|uniref:uncharacterized protein n=1 Tax=Penicillium nucicola TaxID=1850975 RepID=UPI0025453DAC|nr:uncharacterized protein N7511_002889 [Penicillium nucicola]KAJ5770838.1 hypothetical protein N7511_002889 [Penicillium nucicola]
MGIQYLTKHLLPYAESIQLNGQLPGPEDPPRVRGVVIDGPSLVYHVHHRLLSWIDPSCDILDVQPSCDEVSRGVCSFLFQLNKLGVEIHQICFDGALPTSKRETRLSRNEKSRKRLELARRDLPLHSAPKSRPPINPKAGQIWCSRGLPSRRKNLPENPFMVSCVYEDLKGRWTTESIRKDIDEDVSSLRNKHEYPFAERTVMVPGEADVECARVAKATGSVVLSGDSDLMVHDLGLEGGVVFLDSVQTPSGVWDPVEGDIRGLRICPAGLARKLGVASLRRFAFRLMQDPHLRFAQIVQAAKHDGGVTEALDEYREFLKEYEDEDTHLQPALGYQLPGVYCSDGMPHVYLGVLSEDHARQCAWRHGRDYRALGYSFFNLSRAADNRYSVVREYVRRGGRIVADEVALSEEQYVKSDLGLFRSRLESARDMFRHSLATERFWFLFALAEVYRDASATPTGKQVEKFLAKGYMGQRTDWVDVQLLGQIQATLYSLRILKQLLDIAAPDDDSVDSKSLLAELPPLYIMMSRRRMMESFADNRVAKDAVRKLFTTFS